MFKLISVLSFIPSLWRFARDMAKVMEETIPEDGYGSAKLAAVDAVLRTAIKISDDTDDRMEEKLATLGAGLTDSAVTLMRTTGELQAIADKAKKDLADAQSDAEAIIEVAIDEANAAFDEASGD
jgi:hypothetical protein